VSYSPQLYLLRAHLAPDHLQQAGVVVPGVYVCRGAGARLEEPRDQGRSKTSDSWTELVQLYTWRVVSDTQMLGSLMDVQVLAQQPHT
jgi:hypothetical protein